MLAFVLACAGPGKPSAEADSGEAAEAPHPDITVDDWDLTFPSAPAGEVQTAVVTVTNVGTADLTVRSVALDDVDCSDGTACFAVDGEAAIGTLVPAESRPIVVTRTSTGTSDAGTFGIASDDPATPTAIVHLWSLAAPVAVCGAYPTEIALDGPVRVTWTGSGSYGFAGMGIDAWDWTLVGAPEGSTAMMSEEATAQVAFEPDLAGTYTAELVVTDVNGLRSEPCTATLEAVPTSDLRVEMTWAVEGDDMDLHLVRGSSELQSNGDCYYSDCVGGGPDWGVEGDGTDDPWLDVDDIIGTGPERAGILHPSSRRYAVYVHDFDTGRYDTPDDVTVTIYLYGETVWSDIRTIEGEGEYVPFATIDWPSGVVTAQ